MIVDCGFEESEKQKGLAILDCVRVKSALPFHICENFTGQGLWILEKQRAEGIGLSE